MALKRSISGDFPVFRLFQALCFGSGHVLIFDSWHSVFRLPLEGVGSSRRFIRATKTT